VSLLRLVLAGFLVAAPVQAAEVTVFAAASLKTALDEIAVGWQAESGNRAVLSYGGSAALAKQIMEGAPADVFISAAPEWMDAVAEAGLIVPESRVDIWATRLVLDRAWAGGAPGDAGQHHRSCGDAGGGAAVDGDGRFGAGGAIRERGADLAGPVGQREGQPCAVRECAGGVAAGGFGGSSAGGGLCVGRDCRCGVGDGRRDLPGGQPPPDHLPCGGDCCGGKPRRRCSSITCPRLPRVWYSRRRALPCFRPTEVQMAGRA
jgi:hypothetical protein